MACASPSSTMAWALPAEVMQRLFTHGFTTRKSGHGFGLHSASLAAARTGRHADGQPAMARGAAPPSGSTLPLQPPGKPAMSDASAREPGSQRALLQPEPPRAGDRRQRRPSTRISARC